MFAYLAECISTIDVGDKQIYSTKITVGVSAQKTIAVKILTHLITKRMTWGSFCMLLIAQLLVISRS